MLKNMLIPLDGSAEAESVLPYLRDLAPRFDSQVHILSVGIGRKTRRVNRLLEDYVGRVALSLRNDGINAKPVVLYGIAADRILDFTVEKEIDLIIMATHGRSGISRWWMGSVAEKVISEAPAPVLLIRSQHLQEAKTPTKISFLDKILVPLDGSDIGQAALPYVEILAVRASASVTLLQAISPPGTAESSLLGRPDWKKFLKAMHDAGIGYLKGVAETLKEKGIKTTYEVVTGDPADKIVEYAERTNLTLIAMSTHGRTGLARWVLGSVADKVLHGATIPVFLVRSPKMIVSRPKGR